jgi:HAD superfamily hydrolase (TIGR01509 family)
MAWSAILNEDLNAGLSKNEVKRQMYGKNSELLERIFGKNHFNEQQIDELSVEKEKRYQRAYLPHLRLLAGLDSFLKKARQYDIAMAIGSAAITFNIDFVLDNLDIREYFSAIVSADDVVTSKPNPETFLKAADILKLRPEECMVFEDAPKGVEAALNAGMKSVVLTTMHTSEEFSSYSNVWGYCKDYHDEKLNGLFD